MAPLRSALAADATFSVTGPTTSQYSLGGGQTGTISNTGALNYAGNNPTITVDNTSSSASPITITNSGTINNGSTTSSQNGRAIRVTGSNVNLTITNNAGAIIETSNADVIQANTSGLANITVNNHGTINAQNTPETATANFGAGQQAIDLNKLNSGTATVYNYSGAVIEAFESDALQTANGQYIYNDGLIQDTHASGSTSGIDAIDAGTTSGITIDNAYKIGGEGLGTAATSTTAAVANTATISGAHHGITGGNLTTGVYSMTINNNAGGVIKGADGSGVNIDGINGSELVTITNGGTIQGDGETRDGDGVDVDGLVNLTNSGTIVSLNAYAATGVEASEGVTVGGGTIVNTGTIEGEVKAGNSNAVGVGITLAGVDKDASGNPIATQSIYANTSVTNSGHIIGQTSSAIQATGAASSFTISITNQAGGVIEGGGATAAAIQLGGNDDTVVNSGTIEADGSNRAVDLGTGTNSFQVVGGAATVTGNISGGTGSTNSTMTVDPGAGNNFSYSGAISNFNSVEVKSGTFTLSGSIAGGTTTVDNASTLTGPGTTGALTISSGGTISPGTGVGVFHAGTTVLKPMGSFLFQVNNDGSTGTAGTNWDQLAVNGALDLTNLSSSNPFTIDLQSVNGTGTAAALANFNPAMNHVFTDFITTTTGFSGGFSSSDFAVDSSMFANATNGSFIVVMDPSDSDDLDLDYVAAPEPRTWFMLAGGIGFLVLLRRWRNRAN